MEKNFAFQKFAEQMKANTIEWADLSMSYMRDAGCTPLAELIKSNHSLKGLHLQLCYIGDKGCSVIANSLKYNKTLTFLDLCNNKIGTQGAQYLLDCLSHNKTLTTLDLSGNRVATPIRKSIENKLANNSNSNSNSSEKISNANESKEKISIDEIIIEEKVEEKEQKEEKIQETANEELKPQEIPATYPIKEDKKEIEEQQEIPQKNPIILQTVEEKEEVPPIIQKNPIILQTVEEERGRTPSPIPIEKKREKVSFSEDSKEEEEELPSTRRIRSNSASSRPSHNPPIKRSRSHSPRSEKGEKEYSVRKFTGDLDSIDFLFFQNDSFSNEEKKLLHQLEASTICIEIQDGTKYNINARFLPGNNKERDIQGTILLLHGFGSDCSWAAWIKMISHLHSQGLSQIFVDLPGFGRSSGRDIQTRIWKRHGPEILSGILDAYAVKDPVSIIAWCGGAATSMRTFVKYPERFKGKKFIFHNSVTSEIPLGFQTSLIENDVHVLVTWEEDPDHLKCSVGYKGFDKMRKSNYPNLTLVDIGKGVLPLYSLAGKGMGRGTDDVCVFFPSESYLEQVIGFLINELDP